MFHFTMNRNRKKEPHVFIGLCEIAGYNGSLKRGFDELGIQSSFVELSEHPFQFKSEAVNNAWIRLVKFLNARSVSALNNKTIGLRIFWRFSYFASIIPIFLWSLIRFDTFIFVFGQTFFRLYDLPLLKLLGKRILFIFLGSESRPPYLNRKNINKSIDDCVKISHQIKTNVRKIEQYADIIITHPASSHFCEKKFICSMHIGIPTSFDSERQGLSTGKLDKTARIVHAPSHVEGKGTDKIRKSISNLQAKGHTIEYVELTDRPNAEVLRELEGCDFVVDELYSDAVMARFAAEAAFFKKPAIVGGYTTSYDWGYLSGHEIPPVHHCHPDDIEAAIEKLIVDRPYREDLGNRAWEFLTRQWSVRAVAGRYLRLIQGDFPDEWVYDPRDIRYLYGWGLTEDFVKAYLRKYLQERGRQSLLLSDKPSLEQLFVEFALAEASGC